MNTPHISSKQAAACGALVVWRVSNGVVANLAFAAAF